MSKHVAVIGAGPGGLASAMLLAAHGLDVTVFEKHEKPGGRTSTIDAEGFKFDLGPTFFLYPRIIEEIFETCGRSFYDEVETKRLDPLYRIAFESGPNIDAAADIPALQREIAKISAEDAAAVPAFLDDNRKKFDKFQSCLQRPFSSPLDLVKPDLLTALPLMRPHKSVDGDLKRFFKDPRTRQAFSFQTKYLGMSPYQCPSLFTILALLEYEYGVLHPIGGCGAVSRRMAEIAAEMGVRLRYGEPARGFEYEGKKVTAVRTDEGVYPCDAAVVNADFAHAMTELVPDERRRGWNDKTIASKNYSCSTFMLYLGVEGEVDLPHHTVALSDDFAGNIAEIQDDKILPKKPSFYVANPIVSDPTMAPAGQSAVYVLVPVPNLEGETRWDAATTAAMRDFTLQRMADVAGARDIRDRIVYEKVVTPADWRDNLSVYRGATFNLAHTMNQMLYFRPRNRFQDVDGLYLVGGGTHPGSGLPVIYESARISARLLLKDLGLGYNDRAGAPVVGRVRPTTDAEPQTITEAA
ncbi:MAG: phytoene desaturase family protein [Pseudomonadota bacterium]